MITTQLNRVTYTGDGVTTDFPFAAVVLAQTDLVVVQETISSGVSVVKSLGSDYTITGVQDAAGRYTAGITVVAAVAPSALYRWIIYQDPALTQGVDLVDNGLLPVETQIELPLDRLTLMVQRQKARIDRSLSQADGDATDIARLPVKVSRASKFLAFDSNGDPIAAAGTSANLTPVSGFMDTLLDDADAATARATLGVSRDGLFIAPPMPAVRGLRGARHATTTQYTLSGAHYVVLTNADGDSVLRTGVSSLTVNALSAGPIANGRDQAGTFSSTWVNLYYIWNGTTLALIASTANPPTGPVLPSGYTHFAYATSIYYTTEFHPAYVFGNKVHIDVAALSGLNSTSVASIGSLTALVAPLATHIFGRAALTGTATGGGALHMYLQLHARSTSPLVTGCYVYLYLTGVASASQLVGRHSFEMPLLTSQTVYYQNTVVSGTGPSAEVKIDGYRVPNGDTA
ncbi:MAG: hypothetical protein IPK83_20400 [Planctomycetes bacterium]|nr:hypothetical protein [Planctomycetota bacterium]